MPRSSHSIRPTTIEEANARIEQLRRSRIGASCEPENWDGPLDPDIRMEGNQLQLIVEGQKASWTSVCDFEQQLGSRTIRMGGIAGVGTHNDFRFQGLSRRVMINALRYMRHEGFDMAMLYGIPSFYPKFGYAPAFPDVRFTLALRDAERVRPSGVCRFVDYVPEHRAALVRLYHKALPGRVGPTRRDARKWNPLRKGLWWNDKSACRVALDAKGRPVAFLIRHVERLKAKFMEVQSAGPAFYADILGEMAASALEERIENIEFFLPEDDPFVRYCQPLGLEKTVRYRVDGEQMVRLVRVGTALEKVAEDLAERAPGQGRLTLRTNLDSATLAWDGGRMVVRKAERGGPAAQMPQWALAQMLYGYTNASALSASGALAASGRIVDLLDALFPIRPHFHYAIDAF